LAQRFTGFFQIVEMITWPEHENQPSFNIPVSANGVTGVELNSYLTDRHFARFRHFSVQQFPISWYDFFSIIQTVLWLGLM
jgi:hypothetical protein